MRVISRKRRVLLSHGRNSFSRIQQRSAIATWNLRRLGQGNWREKATNTDPRLCEARMESHFALGLLFGRIGHCFLGLGWLLVGGFYGRCWVLLDPGMANMWRRGGERRQDSPDGRSLAVVVPCGGRGFVGRFCL